MVRLNFKMKNSIVILRVSIAPYGFFLDALRPHSVFTHQTAYTSDSQARVRSSRENYRKILSFELINLQFDD